MGKPHRERSWGAELEGSAQRVLHRRPDDRADGTLHTVHTRGVPTWRRLRLLVTQDEELSQVAQSLPAIGEPEADQSVPAGLLALIGSVNGPEDLAEEHDAYIHARLRERFGGSE